MDERELFLVGVGILGLLGSVAAVITGIFGCIFICLSAFLVYQGSSYLARSPSPFGNFLGSYASPRTVWCSKIQYGEVWVPPNVDNALERLYERILTEYVISWYKDLSPCEEFVQEIRILLREVTSNIVVRLNKFDITDTLMGDVVPLFVQHVDGYLWTLHHTKQDVERESDFRANYIGFLGKNVHIALSSREAEVEYLEDLTDRIIPLIIKHENSHSRLVSSFTLSLFSRIVLLNLLDSLCNPRTVNKLLSLWFSPDPVQEFSSSPDPPVKLLFRFVHSKNHFSPSLLHVDLSQILANQELLCQFVKYLKRCGGVHILNFCLAIEDFNKKIMVAELTKAELVALHAEARVLFNTYMREGSSQFISFQSEIVEDIDKILQGEFRDVEKLRTTPPLFRAYEQAFNNLEDNYCPGFHLSTQYLTEAFGSRLTEIKPPTPSKSFNQERGSRGRLSRIKQGVLGQTVEGSPDRMSESGYDMASSLQSDSDASEYVNPDIDSRDLNAWRVEIPRLEARNNGGKSCFVFIIQVQRIDVASCKDGRDLQWVVARQYHEFYTLQSALVQYHGVFEDVKLPTRSKLFRGRGLDVLQSKLGPFEDYIVKLLQKPVLRKSDLLFTFLTSQSEFTEAASQLGLTRIIKSVPKKLTKEKGQFLHGFIDSFITSTLPPSSGNYNYNAEVPVPPTDQNHPMYKDNFSDLFPFTSSTLGPSQTYKPEGLYDIVLYVCMRLIKVNQTVIRLLFSVKWLVESSVNHIVNYLLASKLCSVLNNGRVAYVVDVIQESIFSPDVSLPQEEYKYIEKNTLRLFREYLPGFLRRVNPTGFDEGVEHIFASLQDPCLNKQLVYTLLDNLLPKIFPEIRGPGT